MEDSGSLCRDCADFGACNFAAHWVGQYVGTCAGSSSCDLDCAANRRKITGGEKNLKIVKMGKSGENKPEIAK